MIGAIEAAAHGGAVMYFAPEMSIMINRRRDEARLHICEEAQTESIGRIAEAASRNNIWVHLGSLPVVHGAGPQLANRSIVISANGEIIARYDKIHLFDVDLKSGESWRESSAYVGGGNPVILDTPLGRMGLAVCYDMRFPDLFSAYAKAGVDIITLPSAFTVPTGAAHWHLLQRTRAVEASAAAKSGVVGLVRGLAVELAKDGIRVNGIAPGYIRTAQLLSKEHSLGEEAAEKAGEFIPMGRIGQPEEIADVALFLASNGARYMTGQVVVVDGGLLVGRY